MTEVLREQQLALLEWFVIRARRVDEHSLARDKDQLLTWAKGTLTVGVVDGHPRTARWDLPPEEHLDSLAARCRPFVLNNDPVYWAKVTNALGCLLQEPGRRGPRHQRAAAAHSVAEPRQERPRLRRVRVPGG